MEGFGEVQVRRMGKVKWVQVSEFWRARGVEGLGGRRRLQGLGGVRSPKPRLTEWGHWEIPLGLLQSGRIGLRLQCRCIVGASPYLVFRRRYRCKAGSANPLPVARTLPVALGNTPSHRELVGPPSAPGSQRPAPCPPRPPFAPAGF